MADTLKDRLFSIDRATRTKRTFHYDDDDGSFVIATKQDIQPVLEVAQEARKEARGFKGDGFHRVANVPNPVWWDLHQRGIWMDDKKLLKWLEERDNKVFKTHRGRLA